MAPQARPDEPRASVRSLTLSPRPSFRRGASRRQGRWLPAVVAWAILVTGLPSRAVAAEFVYVGDAGNAANSSGFGAVGYAYEIGRSEVTIGQYTAFLNAVAATDTYGLYDSNMGSNLNVAGITRSGSSGSYTYSVMNNGGSSENRPITWVSWSDAARYSNWMANGQPTGAQTTATTENGAYNMTLATWWIAQPKNATNPNTNAAPTFFIPTQNEWYKAAFYSPNLNSGSGGYYAYATQSNSAPGNTIGGAANQANYYAGNYTVTHSASFSSSQNYLTDAGAFTNGTSYYGTVDQSGNVWEWNDLDGTASSNRGLRGGSWQSGAADLSSDVYYGNAPYDSSATWGFRLASAVPTALTWNTTSGTWGGSTLNWTDGSGSTYTLPAGSTATFSNASGGTISLSGSMQPTAVAVTASSGTYAFTSSTGNVIGGTAALSKSGAGVAVLSGSNAYSGGTTLSAGTLRVGHDGALGSGTLTLGGGTFASADATARALSNTVSITADTTLGDATGTGGLTFSGPVGLGGATRTLTTTSNVTVSGVISNGGLTKAGAGSLILSGSNTYSGGTTISAGTLQIGAGSTTGSIAGNVTNNSSLAFNRSDAITYSGSIDGTGSLTQAGSGTLILSGSNTYSGGTNIDAGTISLGNANALGSTGTISFHGGVLQFGAGNTVDYGSRYSSAAGQTYAFDTNSRNVIIGAALASPDGTLTKYGFGSLWLTAANTYAGSTRSVGGTIDVRHALALQNTTLDLNANDFGAVWFGQSSTLGGLAGSRNMAMNGWTISIGNNNTDTTYSGILSNGAITKIGDGTLTLTGPNTYSGGTTVSAGTLVGTTSSLQGAITNNAAVTFNQATSGTYAGTMSGAGSLTKSGLGTVTLSGASNYSGATTVSAGTLSVVGSLGATTVSVASGATLGGTGRIGGDILADGLLAPGVNGIGLLDLGSLTLQASSTTTLEIAGQGSGAGVAGTGYDSVLSRNGLTYGGSLVLSFLSNPLFDNGTAFALFQNTGARGGTFTSVTTAAGSGRYAGMTFQHHPNGNWYTPDTAGGQYLAFSPATGILSIVPEPSTWAMLATGIAAGGWKLLRRRRQRSCGVPAAPSSPGLRA